MAEDIFKIEDYYKTQEIFSSLKNNPVPEEYGWAADNIRSLSESCWFTMIDSNCDSDKNDSNYLGDCGIEEIVSVATNGDFMGRYFRIMVTNLHGNAKYHNVIVNTYPDFEDNIKTEKDWATQFFYLVNQLLNMLRGT